jgi:hypothetical protein
MNKFTKGAVILIGVVFVFCVGRCFYMVACISCTPDPLKTFNYPDSMDRLESNFKNFCELNPGIYYKISR